MDTGIDPYIRNSTLNALDMVSYTSMMLRFIGSTAKVNFLNFHLLQHARTRIISLGIRKQKRSYRQSRAGTNLFYKIHQWVTDRLRHVNNEWIPNFTLLKQIPPTAEIHKFFHLSHVNARSITNKVNQFQIEVLDRDIDICAITETWKKQDDIDTITNDIPPIGYKILSTPRPSGHIGGLTLVYKDRMTIKKLLLEESTPLSTMELQGYSLRIGNSTINLYVLYQLLHTSVLQFCNELSNILELNVTLPANHTIFTGDFNIHVEDHLDGDTINFLDVLDSYNLRNRVTFLTHIKQHHLHLVIEDQTDTLITHITPGLFLSDHCFTHAILDIVRPWPQRQTVSYQKFRLINHEAFRTPHSS